MIIPNTSLLSLGPAILSTSRYGWHSEGASQEDHRASRGESEGIEGWVKVEQFKTL